MRRPSSTELSAEDRSLTRRWAFAVTSFYSAIVIVMIAVALATSTADRTIVATNSESTHPMQDRADARSHTPMPYGSLPNMGVACMGSQPCMNEQTRRITEAKR
jgi:hypothetical protein